MKVLMATDGSKNATAALRSACHILSREDRNVDIMCVAPSPRGDNHVNPDRLRRRAARILDSARTKLAAEGVSARPVVRTGSPAGVLIVASQEYDVTVVAAESHGNGWVGLGPVATRVAEHANTTVLVARQDCRDSGVRVLAAVDGTDRSLRALDTMTSLLDLSEADVTLVHVIEIPWMHAGPDQEWIGYEEETEERIDPQAQCQRGCEYDAEGILEKARERLPARTAVSTLVYRGLPADEILSEAATGDYDLVMMSASGLTDLKHQILGSVSSKVAFNAPCSVLLVRSAN